MAGIGDLGSWFKKRLDDVGSFSQGAYNQVNPWDNGRDFQHRTAQNNKSFGQQTMDLGQAIVRPVGQMFNTAAAQVPQAWHTGEGTIAQLRGDKPGLAHALEMQRHANSMFGDKGGLFDVGTFYNANDAQKGDFATGATKIGGGTLQTMATVAPFARGGSVSVGLGTAPLKQTLIKVAPKLAGEGAGYGAAFSTGAQLQNNGRVDPGQLAADTLLGAGGNVALPYALRGTKNTAIATGKGVQHVGRVGYERMLENVAQGADTVNIHPSLAPAATKQLDPTRVKAYANMIENGNEVKPLVVTRGKDGEIKVLDGEHRAAAFQELGLPIPTKTVTGEQLKMATQGGYIKVPGKGEYNPSKVIKKAENDYADGKITGDQLEKIRQTEAKAGTATQETGLPQELSPVPEGPTSLPAVSGKTSTVKINTKRLAIPDEAKNRLAQQTNEVIDRLSFDEMKTAAKSAGIDFKSYGVEGTKKKLAQQLNLRNEIATVEDQIAQARATGDLNQVSELMKHSAELGRTSRAQGTDIARQLAARRIIADELATPQQKLFRLFDEAGVDPEVYTKKMASIDLNNADEVMRAYREMVPAKFHDWLDKYRYTNMLSSPLTHMVNITSNLTGLGGVAPVQKAFEGAVDATRSAITGGPRTRYASEAGAYMKGAAQSVPEAIERFKNVMTGKQLMDMPDADALKHGKLAYGGAAGAADSILSVVPKLLEASDQLGMTLSRGGEKAALLERQSKGIKIKGDLDGMVDDAAKYRVFRQELGNEGQGAVLGGVDFIPQMLMQARNSKNPIVSTIAKFSIPFVTTPANLFKQGIEYSPAGVLTLPGHADKTGQVAKMAMGTTVMGLAAGAFAANDAMTFAEPANAAERDAFRAEGKQPYSVKIGDHWVNYSKLHPAIAFNFATVAAVKDALDKGSIDQSTADKILNTAGGVLGYFRDQSYMKAVGDFTANMELKDGASIEDAFASLGSNWANQLSPFKSMVSWIGRQVDPTQRKTDYSASAPEQIYQNIVKDIPGLNAGVPTREDPYTGQPIKNDNPILNAWSPLRITNDKGYGNTTGLNVNQRQMMMGLPGETRGDFRQSVVDDKFATKQINDQKEQIKLDQKPSGIKVAPKGGSTGSITQLADGSYYAKINGEFKTFDTEKQAKQAAFKSDFAKGDKKIAYEGDDVYLKGGNGEVKVMPKIRYEVDQITANVNLGMDRAKGANDINQWLGLAEKKYQALEYKKQLFDPTTEADEIAKITLEQENLLDNVEKYQSYGGFKKGGKGGRGGGGVNLPSINTTVSSDLMNPVVTQGSYQAPKLQLKGGRNIRVARKRSGVKIKAPRKLA